MSQKIYVSPAVFKEEIANIYTHGLGVVLFIPASFLLLSKAYHHQSYWEITSAYIFGGSLVMMFLTSTIYHATSRPRTKAILQILDHAAIFVLIAGTYTPFILVGLKDKIHVSFIVIMWSIAFAGIVFKIFATEKHKRISTLIYLAMGWMAVFKGGIFYDFLSAEALTWILIGGVFYSIGTIFYSRKSMAYHHAVWHVFVLCGSASHFIAVYFYIY